MKNKRFIAAMALAAAVYSIPVIAKLRNPEMLWDETDFIAAAILLFGSAIVFEFVARQAARFHGTLLYKAGAALAVLTALFMVWCNLAVGIIGSEDNPANLMYLGVLAIAAAGAFIGRFMPANMARSMFVTAAANVLVALIAIIGQLGMPFNGPVQLANINAFFIILWIVSGLLFYASARPRQYPVKESHA